MSWMSWLLIQVSLEVITCFPISGIFCSLAFKSLFGYLPVTSNWRTCSLFSDTLSRPERRDFLTEGRSFRAVAMIGMLVFVKRCLVRANPIPRDAGVTRAHAISSKCLSCRLCWIWLMCVIWAC